MTHALLQPVQDFIRVTATFRQAELTHLDALLSEANGNLNRGILAGTVDGFEVTSIERQMRELRRQARQSKPVSTVTSTGAEYIARVQASRIARQKSPSRQSKFPEGHKAKVIPFRLGLPALKRHLPQVS